jgi:acetolactate synthase small subunit
MTGESTLVVIADHTMEALNRIISVLRARRYRIVALTLAAYNRPGLVRLTIGLDPAAGTALRAVPYLERIEEVREVRVLAAMESEGASPL